MIIQIWYCPHCDHETYNWRKCPACKGDAVYQKFICTPVIEEKENEISLPANPANQYDKAGAKK